MVLAQDASVAPQPRVSNDYVVTPDTVWTATDLQLQPGERLVFKATGTARCGDREIDFGPAGLPRGFRDLLRILPVAQAGRGALIGRIGDAAVAIPFVIGGVNEMVTTAGGPLSIGVNRGENDPCNAAFKLHVDVFPASAADPSTAVRVESLVGIDQQLLRRLPRRVGDQDGNAGDMVNFLILGTQEQLERTFKTAGWVVVDRDIKSAIFTGALNSLSKEAYLTLPMSQLYLFGRPQDYGWAHAEPIKVVASRHHLRIWKADTEVEGTAMWVGAATHDIGFDRDRRNNGITHKIDPEVDLEREYVEKTLTSTGIVSQFTYVMPDDPLREAKTATGGTFRSDGRVLVLKLFDATPSTEASSPPSN
jgi:hypothetical protein